MGHCALPAVADALPRAALAAGRPGGAAARGAVLVAHPGLLGARVPLNVVMMPIVFLAMLDGLRRSGLLERAGQALGRPGGAGAGAADRGLLGAVTDFGRPGPEVVAMRRALAVIPDGVSVAASNRLAPQLTGRCSVSLFPYLTYPGQLAPWGRPTVTWVATLDPLGEFPVSQSAQLSAQAALSTAGYRVVATGGESRCTNGWRRADGIPVLKFSSEREFPAPAIPRRCPASRSCAHR